jgi:hypothetical protein
VREGRIQRLGAWYAAFWLAWITLAVTAAVWRGMGLPLVAWVGIPLVIALTFVIKRLIDERGM